MFAYKRASALRVSFPNKWKRAKFEAGGACTHRVGVLPEGLWKLALVG